jgi:hypothetical protein
MIPDAGKPLGNGRQSEEIEQAFTDLKLPVVPIRNFPEADLWPGITSGWPVAQELSEISW